MLKLLHMPRAFQLGRCLSVLLLFAAWYGASNRCALGLMSASRTAGQVACCGHLKADSGPVQKSGMACCKTLHAVPALAKEVWLAAPSDFAQLGDWAPATDLTDLRAPLSLERHLDTGPPEARSFSELVLHRSLRSHAPPNRA